MSSIQATYTLPPHTQLEIAQGDLTQETTDAIVNAANSRLAHGGGVAGAIVRAGGRSIQEESDAWVRQHGPVLYGEPAFTGAGKLRCRYVIHAVGPVWGEGDEDRKLSEAVAGSLRRAEALGLKSIAFPAISTGIFGFPKERAARIFCETIADYFAHQPASGIDLVRITLWDQGSVQVFLATAKEIFG
jgi:O-acetyl-ADP-ribose deacetylase